MDVVLVSSRGREAMPHPSRERAATLARALAERDHRVRWLCPVGPSGGPAVRLPALASFVPVPGKPARFAQVAASYSDAALERAFSIELRRRLPDLVHVVGFGGTASASTPWIARRLGAPAIVSLRTADLVCHRGTLQNERGQACTEWHRPERCAACCTAPWEHGLSAASAARAQRLRWLGRWSPFPHPASFAIRLDELIGGLLQARGVLVRDLDRAILTAVGLPEHLLHRAPSDSDLEGWVALHTALAAGRAPTQQPPPTNAAMSSGSGAPSSSSRPSTG